MLASGDSVKTTFQSIMIGNFAWGMIHVVQIISHTALFNVQYPGNAIVFFNFLVNIANYQLFDVSPIQNIVFNFTQDDTPDQFNNLDIFEITF